MSPSRPAVLSPRMACVDDFHAGTTSNNTIDLYACNQTVAQSWTVKPGGTLSILGGWFSNACLDDTNASKTNGNPLQIYTCNGEVQQSWNPPNL
jgi:alpha-L-fucosidase